MNFYQRRLATLSSSLRTTAHKLNLLKNPSEVEDLFPSPNFFLTKDKKPYNKEVVKRIMEFHKTDEKHANQIIELIGYEQCKKDCGVK